MEFLSECRRRRLRDWIEQISAELFVEVFDRRICCVLEKPTVSQLVKKFPAFYGTRKNIVVLISARHLSLSRVSAIQSLLPIPLPDDTSMPWSSKWSLSLRFPRQNPVLVSPILHTCNMSRPSHSSRFYHPNNIWPGAETIKLLIM